MMKPLRCIHVVYTRKKLFFPMYHTPEGPKRRADAYPGIARRT